MNKERITRVLLLLATLLVLPLGLTAIAQDQPAPIVINDTQTLNSFIDLHSVEVTDNGTHLLVRMNTGGQLPEDLPLIDSSKFYYEIDISLNVLLDIDNNVSTGAYTIVPPGGGRADYVEAEAYEAVLGVDLEIDASYMLTTEAGGYTFYYHGITAYNPDGTTAGTMYDLSIHATVEDNSIVFAFNLGDLVEYYTNTTGRSIEDTSHMKIYVISSKTYMSGLGFTQIMVYGSDYVVSTSTNVSVPAAEITVDGDVSDWAGVEPFIIDDDTASLGILAPGWANITKAYIATSNGILYLRVDFESPWASIEAADYGWTYFKLYFKTYFYLSTLTIPSGEITPTVIAYAMGDTTLEVAFNASLIGYPDLAPGDNVTIEELCISISYMDPLDTNTTYISYTVGEGGVLENTPSGNYVLGEQEIRHHEATLRISTTDTTGVILATYHEDPMGTGAAGAPEDYWVIYYLTVEDPSLVTWPITLEINYTSYLQPGISEEQITPYYYDKTLASYTPLPTSTYTIDTANNIITITITQELYELGDPAIILGPPPQPPTVGGEIEAQKPEATLALLAILLAILILGITAARRLAR